MVTLRKRRWALARLAARDLSADSSLNRWVLDTRSEFQQLGFGQISQLGDPAHAITVSFALLAEDQPPSLWGLPQAREVPMKELN